jgi:hypothetical protein
LLGDPAMRLAYPNSSIVLDSVNSKTIGANDTLVSGKLYTFKGSVMAPRSGAITGSVNSNFNGTLYFTLYDKQITRTTLKNDPATAAANYQCARKYFVRWTSERSEREVYRFICTSSRY